MIQLHLAFLGSPEVQLNDQRLAFPTRKTLALLIYLAVEGERHSREKLQTLFWPESTLVRGRGALRTTLAYLRRVLAAVPSQNFLLSQGDALGFNPEAPFFCDVHLVATAGHSNDPQIWHAAVAHCRGPFLDGFSLPDAPAFDEWLTLQRQHWQQQINQLCQQLVQWQMDRRLFPEGIATATQWVNLDPLNEAAYRCLMQCHFMAGERTAAWQTYLTCQTLLADDLGIEPSAETRALAERIRAEEQGSNGAEGWRRREGEGRVDALPFVGREVEHEQLAASFQAAGQGHTQVAVIVGEAGMGKTRLATEFLQWTAVHCSDIWQGHAFEAGGRLSYQPVVDALRERLERENAPDDLLSDVWLAELGRLLPELYDRYPDLPPPVRDENLARTRLLEAVVRLGTAVTGQDSASSRKPIRSKTIIFFIDDIQWADEASLDLLQYTLRRWQEQQMSLLLLFTMRTESLATNPNLKEWLAHLGRHLPLIQLELDPLTAEETAQLVTEWQRDEERYTSLPSPLADWLYRETTGQPFYIAETLKALQDRGLLGDSEPDQSFIPATVRQLILARLQGLSPQATDLLTAAAVIGRRCRFEHLCQIAALSENEGLTALDQLVNGRLLSETADLNRPYQFAHDKIRDVAYTEAGDARRRIYHRRAFQALQQTRAPAAELAHHAIAAYLPEPAFRYSLAAGEAAMSLFAVRDAIAHYEQAYALKQQSPISNSSTAPGKTLQSLYTSLARAYELTSQHDKAQAICEEMLAVARRENQPAMACAALNRLASIAIYTHHLPTAETHLQQALHIASQNHDKASLAQTHWSLSQLTHHQGNFQASKEQAELALVLARELKDAALIAGILNNLGHAQGMSGDMVAAEMTMTEAVSHLHELGNKALEADSLVGLTLAYLLQGQTQAGIATARTAYQIGREIENEFGQCMSRPWLAFGLLDSGAYEEALTLAQQNLQAARPQGGPPLLLASISLGLVFWFWGLAAEARQAHQANEAVIAAAGVRNYVAQNQANFCADAVLAGDWALAGEHARQSLAHQDYKTVPLIYVPLWPLTAALLHNNAADQARADVDRRMAWIGQIPRYQISHHRSLALLAEYDSQPAQAIHHLEQALKLAEQMNLPGEQWPILAQLSQLYRDEAAAKANSRAVGIIKNLAGHIVGVKLREKFVAANSTA